MHEQALIEYTSALELNENNPAAKLHMSELHNEWGVILFNRRKFDLAIKEFTKATFYFKRARYYVNRAKALMLIKKVTPSTM